MLMAIGAFGPWVKALGQSVGGTDGSNDGWLVVAAAAIGGLLFYATRSTRAAGIWTLLAGAAGLAVTVYDRNNIQNKINQSGAFVKALASVGWGLNLALAASASMALAGLIWVAQTGGQEAALQAPLSAPPVSEPPPVVSAPPES
ncbi:MAG TPA: hypothetical protein VNC40_00030 [Gaiellaceae bacterium]|nr:hypothetical protein [Gaiellaceae bacterium]